jgi:hypothetical protein
MLEFSRKAWRNKSMDKEEIATIRTPEFVPTRIIVGER